MVTEVSTMTIATYIRVADECWIALVSLHRDHSDRPSFSASEILDRVKVEKVSPELRAGVQAHIYLHNVANLPPNSATYRMFYKREDGTYRLFKPGDDFHPKRKGKMCPEREELPAEYQALVDWYQRDYCGRSSRQPADEDFVLQMRGLGQEIWSDLNSDDFVSNLRSGWEPDPNPSRLADQVWQRIVAYQNEIFYTTRRYPFTYSVDGSAIWFYRKGKRIDIRLARSQVEAAIARCPLENTTDIKDLRDYAYLFGLLMDRRIRKADW
jgi:hypothetical protein